MIISFDEAGKILDRTAESLPVEIFKDLNGGINLLHDTVEDADGWLVMGMYIIDNMGSRIEIYYGSFEAAFEGSSYEEVEKELIDTLKHELTHHIETLAGDKSLERWDEAQKMESGYVIRDVIDADLPKISKIELECFSLPWTADMLKTQISDRHIFLVAVEKEEILGYIGLMKVLDEGHISNVAVAEKHRGNGIANELLNELLDRTKDLSFLTLEVRESNEPAISLYKKFGFFPVGLRKNYYEKPKENALIMTLEK